MAEADLDPGDIIWDGSVHRFKGKKQKKKDGWYIAFPDRRGASFGEWGRLDTINWQADRSEEPTESMRAHWAEVEATQKKVRETKQKAAIGRVKEVWSAAVGKEKKVLAHPYLKRKEIESADGLRITTKAEPFSEKWELPKGTLLVPMRIDGELVNIQSILADGTKLYWPKAPAVGAASMIGGEYWSAEAQDRRVFVTEGWATGWSIAKAVNRPVVVCFSTGGIRPVTKRFMDEHRTADFIIAADNDRWSVIERDGSPDIPNPGVHYATEAAEELEGDIKVAIPDFQDLEDKPTDFDDLRRQEGMESVEWWLDPENAGMANTTPHVPEGEGDEPERPSNGPSPETRKPAKPSNQSSASSRVAAPRFSTTPQALGERLLAEYQSRILIVEPGNEGATGWRGGRASSHWGESVAYTLHESGRWDPTPDPWRDMLTAILTDIESSARRDLRGNAIAPTLRSIHAALKKDNMVHSVRLNLSATAKLNPDAYPNLTRCTVEQLDANLRYFGCDNGVVDLDKGVLLKPEEGRKALVTHTTGVKFDPDATHSDVELLFRHLGKKLRNWYWAVMAHALHGRPARRLYLVVGERGGGKTQMAQALVGSLGEYAKQPMDSALTESGTSGQHNTELAAFAHPTRICVMDEVNTPRWKVSSPLLKRLSGDGSITFRRLHENPQTRAATGTLFLICNPRSIPRLRLEDEAMQDRLRELPYPSVPAENRDPSLPARLKTPEFRAAFLAKLVARAKDVKPGYPPASIPTVQQATAARVTEDIGEIGTFAQHLRPADGKNLSVPKVWKAWCEDQGVDGDAKEAAGGVTRKSFTRRLRDLVPDLPPTKSVRINGKTVRGWTGWELRAAGQEDQ